MSGHSEPSGAAWHPDSHGVSNQGGTCFGPNQWDEAWSVRLVRDDVPTAFIQVNSAVILNAAGRYCPEVMIEFLVGTDPEDLAGSEDWSGYQYPSGHLFDYERPQEAQPFPEQAVRRYAENAAQLFAWWDGVTPVPDEVLVG